MNNAHLFIQTLLLIVETSLILRSFIEYQHMKRTSIWFAFSFIFLIFILNLLLHINFSIHQTTITTLIMMRIPIALVFVSISKYKDSRFIYSYFLADNTNLFIIVILAWLQIWISNLWIIYLFQIALIIIIFYSLNSKFRPKFLFTQESMNENWLLLSIHPFLLNITFHLMLESGLFLLYQSVEYITFITFFNHFFQLIVSYKSFNNYIQFKQLESKNNLLNEAIENNHKNTKNQTEKDTHLKILRHDLRHHLCNLNRLILNKKNNLALDYITYLDSEVISTQPIYYCENLFINSVISNFAEKIQKEYIAITTNIMLPMLLPINEIDLSIVISNALENAINANKKIENNKDRKIHFVCKLENNTIKLTIRNPVTTQVEFEAGLPITNEQNHGLGTKSIAAIAKKYNGSALFQIFDHEFICMVYLDGNS